MAMASEQIIPRLPLGNQAPALAPLRAFWGAECLFAPWFCVGTPPNFTPCFYLFFS